MENEVTNNDYSKVKLSEKEKILERLTLAGCALLLLAFFLKILFF